MLIKAKSQFSKSDIFFDRDARRSGPTIHFDGFVVVVVVVTLVQNLL